MKQICEYGEDVSEAETNNNEVMKHNKNRFLV